MPDALAKTAGVAVIPCYNEGRNPIDLCAPLLGVPDLRATFVDDASEGESGGALQSIGSVSPRIRVVRNSTRVGKVASLLSAMRSLDPDVERVLLLDCDVVVDSATLARVLLQLERADLVLVNAVAMAPPRTFWERGAIFSARRHERLRARAIRRYPALCSNGRLLGMSRRLVEAILSSDVPRHTEDAHFMLVCLDRGFTYAYAEEARIEYRAPDALDDYLRQSNRFSEGRSLLAERWPAEMLEQYYDPQAGDLLATFFAQALDDPIGALAFAAMLGAKMMQRAPVRSQQAAWAVAGSTKSLRSDLPPEASR
jgi:cellulose synthase/poly-beta-1,6-N-acetylglucosamine synthase-like glycosyltransferase